jgi:hypothetical protein
LSSFGLIILLVAAIFAVVDVRTNVFAVGTELSANLCAVQWP